MVLIGDQIWKVWYQQSRQFCGSFWDNGAAEIHSWLLKNLMVFIFFKFEPGGSKHQAWLNCKWAFRPISCAEHLPENRRRLSPFPSFTIDTTTINLFAQYPDMLLSSCDDSTLVEGSSNVYLSSSPHSGRSFPQIISCSFRLAST